VSYAVPGQNTAGHMAHVKPPKHIEVDGHHIHLRLLQQIAWIVITASLGAYIITALYYLVIEVHWYYWPGHSLFSLKYGWDHLINRAWWHPDAAHDYRNCFEGALGTLLAKSVITKRKYWAEQVSDLQVVVRVVLLVVVSFLVITLGIYIVDIQTKVHIGTTVHNYQAYLIGFIAAQACHRIWAPAGNTIQLFFLESSVAKAERTGKLPLWVQHPVAPPNIRERFSWMLQGKRPADEHGRLFTTGAWILATILVLLALYGTFVHFWIAPGHAPAGALF
jgi:hypothetical protein